MRLVVSSEGELLIDYPDNICFYAIDGIHTIDHSILWLIRQGYFIFK